MVSKKRKKARRNFLGGGTREAYNNLDKFRSKEAEIRLSSQRKENSKDFLYRLEKSHWLINDRKVTVYMLHPHIRAKFDTFFAQRTK